MIRPRTTMEANTEIEFHASGFLVKVEGTWTDAALAQFQGFVQYYTIPMRKIIS